MIEGFYPVCASPLTRRRTVSPPKRRASCRNPRRGRGGVGWEAVRPPRVTRRRPLGQGRRLGWGDGAGRPCAWCCTWDDRAGRGGERAPPAGRSAGPTGAARRQRHHPAGCRPAGAIAARTSGGRDGGWPAGASRARQAARPPAVERARPSGARCPRGVRVAASSVRPGRGWRLACAPPAGSAHRQGERR
jgi:hypothetical protein